jgi:sugar-phosphatase
MKEFLCDAVLLDMDGTLVDSTEVVVRQWRRWADQHGVPLEQILSNSHGVLTIDTMRRVAPNLATAEEAEAFERSETEDVDGVKAVKGASAFLGHLEYHQWAVVTSASRELARVRLLAADLPLPNVLVSADDVRAGKPDPEGYLTAAKLLGAVPKQCLVVEDSIAGIQAARRAGMFVLGITTTLPAEQLDADARISDFSDLRVAKSENHRGIRIQVTSA